MADLDRLPAGSVKAALEALLLVSSDPVPATELAKALGIAPGEAVEALSDLSAEYEDAGRGFQLRQVAGGWRLYTHPAYHDQVESYVLSWDTRKLSQAALETLAVIAYHQPVTREGVKAVRGVNSEGVVASLVDKGLVRELGRSKEANGAVLYGTTTAFLEHFGLRSLKDLPPLEDFAPDEEAREFIRERLSGRAPMPAEGVPDEADPAAVRAERAERLVAEADLLEEAERYLGDGPEELDEATRPAIDAATDEEEQ
ncbi:SMC-Scp complex subunit ScpB [Olsenella sp. YH-ols2217]|uniref:SMC-Scp complex subunit ScpB n=1 Tax=Kribbibacterium absianum TaxID=3044210 RepID=A0ABT6ZIQ3_9ACTN|nr:MULTISPECIES: SMC-Scp complex subunit ScpB [unclassified Olsenella]MDJ1121437.1 SMC-Scp complex subunit ScpB [Olsenella sp. YH-ols2216]MDJ1128927.1 SMC-Scp complex subunit ScpB [Olsenella sp. YH-ols2217]